MKEYLCKCTNCGTIMFDENPQVDAEKVEIPKEGAESMAQLRNGNTFFWACPICKTDSYLIDL